MMIKNQPTKCFLLCISICGIALCALLGWQDGVYLCAGGSCAALIGVFDD
jgi:hypothetical protein